MLVAELVVGEHEVPPAEGVQPGLRLWWYANDVSVNESRDKMHLVPWLSIGLSCHPNCFLNSSGDCTRSRTNRTSSAALPHQDVLVSVLSQKTPSTRMHEGHDTHLWRDCSKYSISHE